MRVGLGSSGKLRKISVQYEFLELKEILGGRFTILECARIIRQLISPMPGKSKAQKI
jgi:hypothetical protein